MPTPREHDSAELDDSEQPSAVDGEPTQSHDKALRTRLLAAVAPVQRLWANDSGRTGLLMRVGAGVGAAAIVVVALTTTTAGEPDTAGTAAANSEHTDKDQAGRSHTRDQQTPSENKTEVKPSETESAPPPPAEEKKPPQPVGGLDEDQMANAVTVVEIGKDLGFNERGQAVALVTAMQESLMRNVASEAVPESLNYDHQGTMLDYDSVGLFQQRPSMGWGTVEECMDVEYSTSTFYKALRNIGGWEDMALTAAAQAVQGSAFPDAYAQWEDMAWAVIEEVNG